MNKLRQQIIDNIKMYAEHFLLDASEFYPFGALIKPSGEVVPLAGYVKDENDMPASTDVLEILQGGLENRHDYSIAAIGVDVLIRNNGQQYDALEIRIFENAVESEVLRCRYIIGTDSVRFEAV